ncbi:CocE/NonD family hydrolase, partial [Arthrobacter deserti]|nr:CocE/NonD family hydrolase [Arthrobacter deserti]
MTETVETLETTAIDSIRVPMRDGVLLAATVYRPAGTDVRPVLLVRTPYNEQMSRTLPVAPALEAGFAVVVQNCRGTAGSGGELWAFENEADDGLDTIEWLRGRPWCNGQ